MIDEDLPELQAKIASGEKEDKGASDAKGDDAGGEEDTSLMNSDVVSKYQDAAKVTNQVLTSIIENCKAGAKVYDICKGGDDLILSLTSTMYRAKVKSGDGQPGRVIEKGVAFPVCISVNECVCHMSPLASEADEELKDGDWVKIDFGVHIDGYMTVAAHTLIVGADTTSDAPTAITGKQADVLTAAWNAAEVVARMIQAGNKNKDVTAAIKKVSEAYGVNPVSGTLMHQMKRYVIDGSKMILAREDPDHQKVDECTFEAGEVYAIDLCFSTGEGKPNDDNNRRTTVYKRKVETKYSLKNASSRKLFNEVQAKYPSLPFSTRMIEDENMMKLGVIECKNHSVILPYDVLYEQKGTYLAHVKYTVLILQSGTIKVTGMSLPKGIQSDKQLPEDLKELIANVSIEKKKKDRGKKKPKKKN